MALGAHRFFATLCGSSGVWVEGKGESLANWRCSVGEWKNKGSVASSVFVECVSVSAIRVERRGCYYVQACGKYSRF